ncbi:MAG TPA: tRNA (adenosine(37)-N6)-dimethylallyltransferase MiaA [Verrucomicrobiae bacterium]|nr:tRNA (adenosine(37)-N6)-dimethylallyltransferase MiaA [Verrucomicrobiae bacterium]
MRDPIFIAGPTAGGKSALALLVARQLDGEIISADSMQVYRGLDIGTAKPSTQERQQVPHHLVDILEPDENFDAAQFLRLARAAEADIQSRGRLPIYCGGTGLFFKALVAGVGEAPPGDQRLRDELEAIPLPKLLDELSALDPVLFATIDRSNVRRVIRAMEVIRLSGKPYSELRSNWSDAEQKGFWFGLERERSELKERIDRRVEGMFAAGLVHETRELLKRRLWHNRTAMQAIGYRQVVEHLRGVRSLEETVELVKLKTRQYAKRQMTWFRHQLRLHWLKSSGESMEPVAAQIYDRLRIHQVELAQT